VEQYGPIDYARIKQALAEKLRLISVYVDNGLNQTVTVQIKANREASYSKSVNVGSSFAVPANSQDARSLSVETSGWLPYIMVEVSCSTAPTSGSLTIYRIRSKDDQVKLVDALEIRDTALHTPASDSERVKIVEW
jgi:hypothetical protein